MGAVYAPLGLRCIIKPALMNQGQDMPCQPPEQNSWEDLGRGWISDSRSSGDGSTTVQVSISGNGSVQGPFQGIAVQNIGELWVKQLVLGG